MYTTTIYQNNEMVAKFARFDELRLLVMKEINYGYPTLGYENRQQ